LICGTWKLICRDDDHSSTVQHPSTWGEPNYVLLGACPSKKRSEIPLAEYKVARDGGSQDDGLPGGLHREVNNHDRRYRCDGHIFVDGVGDDFK